jgi:hypothetical protein
VGGSVRYSTSNPLTCTSRNWMGWSGKQGDYSPLLIILSSKTHCKQHTKLRIWCHVIGSSAHVWKVLCCVKMSGNDYPRMWHHIPGKHVLNNTAMKTSRLAAHRIVCSAGINSLITGQAQRLQMTWKQRTLGYAAWKWASEWAEFCKSC